MRAGLELGGGLPVLVTGATGFIGSHLVERLAGLDCRVRCLVRRTSSLKYLPAGVELAQGDLAAGDGLAEAVRGVRLVFHLGGVTKALSGAEYFRGNAEGTANLVRALEASGARLVHVSSLAAAGPTPGGTPVTEDAPPRPLTAYGISKLKAEESVRQYANAVIVRPPVVYGPRDTDVFQVFRAIARGVFVRISREESWFSFIHVADLVEALLAAARPDAAVGRTYYAANAEPASWSGFAQAAADALGRRLRVVSLPAPAAHAAAWLSELSCRIRGKPGILSRDKIAEARCRCWVCDASRAAHELGFTARLSMREGIERTIEWYRRAGWL